MGCSEGLNLNSITFLKMTLIMTVRMIYGMSTSSLDDVFIELKFELIKKDGANYFSLECLDLYRIDSKAEKKSPKFCSIFDFQ